VTGETLVQFDRVAVRRGSTLVIRDLSLSVAGGETVALVGRSGAGKTTLLKLVNRLLSPTAGRVDVQGRDTREWDVIALRRRIGYVFQDVGLFPHFSVEENVSIVPKLEGWPAARMTARARELLDLVGLAPATFARRRPQELSGGQRQRVGLARALAIDPPILLMDEPFGALDPITRGEVRRAFAYVRSQLQTTVMIVTHDLPEACALGDRVAVMEAGELVLCDTPARVVQSQEPRLRALLDTDSVRWQGRPDA